MKPQNRILLTLGRECLRLRKKLLDDTQFGTVEHAETAVDLHTAWNIFQYAYLRYYGCIPRFQLRFY